MFELSYNFLFNNNNSIRKHIRSKTHQNNLIGTTIKLNQSRIDNQFYEMEKKQSSEQQTFTRANILLAVQDGLSFSFLDNSLLISFYKTQFDRCKALPGLSKRKSMLEDLRSTVLQKIKTEISDIFPLWLMVDESPSPGNNSIVHVLIGWVNNSFKRCIAMIDASKIVSKATAIGC